MTKRRRGKKPAHSSRHVRCKLRSRIVRSCGASFGYGGIPATKYGLQQSVRLNVRPERSSALELTSMRWQASTLASCHFRAVIQRHFVRAMRTHRTLWCAASQSSDWPTGASLFVLDRHLKYQLHHCGHNSMSIKVLLSRSQKSPHSIVECQTWKIDYKKQDISFIIFLTFYCYARPTRKMIKNHVERIKDALKI